ncbi:MAG: site-specific integrase [Muribaculaceae bacterium]|nr:site-specific integrase [Muribaculaceae bacterium]
MKTPTARFVFDRKHVSTRSTAKGRKKGLVQIEIMYQRKRRYITTGIKLFKEQWAADKENHVVNSAYADEYNESLRLQMQSVLRDINRQVESGSIDIKAIMGTEHDTMSIGELSELVEQERPSLSDGSKKLYSSVRNVFDAFGKFDSVSLIDASLVAEFDKWMIAGGISGVTRKIRLSHLHMLLKCAVDKGLIASDPMAAYKMPRAKSKEIVYLTDEELERIAQVELPGELLIARDLFLFQCYTGMAWADIATLDRSMIQTQGADTFISRSRKKTQVHYRTKLLTPAIDVMRRHGMEVPMPENYDKYRRQLHKVVKLAGISKNVNPHVGRHTFATWALSHGVSIEIVSKMLGHTKIETTQIYAKVLAKDVEAQFDKLDELFTEKNKKAPTSHDGDA